jgi:Transposase IS66 family
MRPGLRVAGKPHWVHCARTDRYTLITCHAKRGRKGIDDAGVLGRFRGVAVHDVPGRRMTPTSRLNINSAALTRCESCRPSPRPRHPKPSGAGPARPPPAPAR